jgi:hypothetical protein
VCDLFQPGSKGCVSHLGRDGGRQADRLDLEELDGLAPATGRDELGELGCELARPAPGWRRIIKGEVGDGEAVGRGSQGKEGA